MATDATTGYNGTVEVQDGTSSTWIPIKEVVSINYPKPKASFTDASHLASDDFTRESIAAIKDPGECTFVSNYLPDEYARLWDLTGVRISFRFTLPDEGLQSSGPCAVDNVDFNADLDTAKMTTTLKVLGALTLAEIP